MLKAISGISKKILVISIAALFLVSMVLFISPSKIYAAPGTSGVNILSKSGGDVTVGVSAPGYNGYVYSYTYEVRLINNTDSAEIGSKLTGVISSDSWSDSFNYTGLTAGNYVVYFTIKYDGTTLAIEWANFSIAAPASAAAPRPLTAEEQASLDLSIEQQSDLYGKDNTGFTKMLYDNILGRVSDAGGLDDWVTALNNGTITLGDVVYGFVFSKELEPMISSFSNEEFITFLYENVLDRNADPDGYAGWVSAMNSGMSKEDVLLHFIDSGEFKDIYTMFGLTA